MADLLECLLQVKALRESIARLGALRARAEASSDAARRRVEDAEQSMVEAERGWQISLALALPDLAADRLPPDGSVTQFGPMRAATLAVLDRCNAAQLNAAAEVGGGAPGTVADLVAHMLASDTELLGALRVIVERP